MNNYQVPIRKTIWGHIDILAEDEYMAKDVAWDQISEETFVPDMNEFELDSCGVVEQLDAPPNPDLWR
jgi:hypothetical protein